MPAYPQQTTATSSSAQAATFLQKAFSALVGSAPINDVTLAGTARRIAGSDDETGTAVLKALATGEARMDLSLTSGSRSEVPANANNCTVGTWFGFHGVSHPIAYLNLMTDPSWFFPGFSISRALFTFGYAMACIGQKMWNGQSVVPLTVSQPPVHFVGSSLKRPEEREQNPALEPIQGRALRHIVLGHTY